MYNVNPDITVNNPQGGLWYMPGLLAKRYEAMGGRVTYFGKPHKVCTWGLHRLCISVYLQGRNFLRCEIARPKCIDRVFVVSIVFSCPSLACSLAACLAVSIAPAAVAFVLVFPIEPVLDLPQEHYETAVAKMGLGKDRVVHVRSTPCLILLSKVSTPNNSTTAVEWIFVDVRFQRIIVPLALL